jgi:tRNA pseudouridine38-40 synthase
VSARVEAAEHRIRLTLHYDGSGFAGWQLQPGERTVQGELEAALERLTNRPARVIAAGRTDRGVHATGQVVGATVPQKWEPGALRRALNAILPHDIWVADAGTTNDEFHARYDAVARGYVYRVGTTAVSRSPFLRRWCWSLAQPVPLEPLNAAAAVLLGDHSFRAFAKTGQPERGERCTVHRSEWKPWEAGVAFHIVANRFLHHMVRYLVGTMVDVAREGRPLDDLRALLHGDPAIETSPPAPPEGLFLTRVYYQGDNTELEDTIDEILSGQR